MYLIPSLSSFFLQMLFNIDDNNYFLDVFKRFIANPTLIIIPFVNAIITKEKNIKELFGLRMLENQMSFLLIFGTSLLSIALLSNSNCVHNPINHKTKYCELIIFIILECIFPAIFEEIMFRGWLIGCLKKYTNTIIASIISSLIFSFAHHYQSPFGYITIFILSLFWCFLDYATKSIFPSILVHFIHNFSNSILLLFVNGFCEMSVYESLIIWFIGALVLYLTYDKYFSVPNEPDALMF